MSSASYETEQPYLRERLLVLDLDRTVIKTDNVFAQFLEGVTRLVGTTSLIEELRDAELAQHGAAFDPLKWLETRLITSSVPQEMALRDVLKDADELYNFIIEPLLDENGELSDQAIDWLLVPHFDTLLAAARGAGMNVLCLTAGDAVYQQAKVKLLQAARQQRSEQSDTPLAMVDDYIVINTSHENKAALTAAAFSSMGQFDVSQLTDKATVYAVQPENYAATKWVTLIDDKPEHVNSPKKAVVHAMLTVPDGNLDAPGLANRMTLDEIAAVIRSSSL